MWLDPVPKVNRDDVLHKVHNAPSGGHLGEAKTLSRLQERFYWPGHVEAVKVWCRCCADCAARRSPGQRRRAPLQSMHAGYPMQIIAVDIVGPFSPVQSGNNDVLVVSDYFTKWMEAFAIPNQEAVTVAEEEVFCRFSIPEQLHSDQGRQFEGKLMQEVCKLLHIKKTRTTAYHPQSDGVVERLNRTLLSMLTATVHEHPGDWDKKLRLMCMAYNTSVHQSTGFSPFFLLFGCQARLPVDLAYGTAPMEEKTTQEYVRNLRQTLEKAYSTIVDDDEEVLEIQPRDRGQMRKPGQQELPEPQAHEDGHEALESDVQNGELPQQEVPMLEEVAMQNEELTQQKVPLQEVVAMQNQNRYPRRNRRAPDYYGAVPYS
ncbi:hypothetical protein EMCRGX_G029508 [Ephydatia muelleri]